MRRRALSRPHFIARRVQCNVESLEGRVLFATTAIDLVKDGGFETPLAAVFTTYAANQTFGRWKVDGAGIVQVGSYWQAAAGTQSVELNLYAAGGISQTLATVPGATYHLSYDMSGQPNAGAVHKAMQIFWGGKLVSTPTFDTTGHDLSHMGWTHHTLTLVAAESLTVLRFFGSTPSTTDGGPAIDNVSVIGPPGHTLLGFRTDVGYAVGNGPQAVAVADFNGDRKPDFVTANFSARNVTVMMGTGDGFFGLRQDSVTLGFHAQALAVGDFNNDTKPDLVVTGDRSAGGTVVLIGNGDGTFGTLRRISNLGGLAVAVGDFNNDKLLDIAATLSDNNVSIFLGSSLGTFKPPINSLLGSRLSSGIALGDFNRDGKLDLTSANFDDSMAVGSVSVLLGLGNGKFQGPRILRAGKGTRSVTVADLNHDGKLDIVATNHLDNTLSIFPGTGLGTFRTATTIATMPDPTAVVAADFNLDGNIDLATANFSIGNSVNILLGTGLGTFGATVRFFVYKGPVSLAYGDFNNDGKLDIVVANYFSNTFGRSSVLISA